MYKLGLLPMQAPAGFGSSRSHKELTHVGSVPGGWWPGSGLCQPSNGVDQAFRGESDELAIMSEADVDYDGLVARRNLRSMRPRTSLSAGASPPNSKKGPGCPPPGVRPRRCTPAHGLSFGQFSDISDDDLAQGEGVGEVAAHDGATHHLSHVSRLRIQLVATGAPVSGSASDDEQSPTNSARSCGVVGSPALALIGPTTRPRSAKAPTGEPMRATPAATSAATGDVFAGLMDYEGKIFELYGLKIAHGVLRTLWVHAPVRQCP